MDPIALLQSDVAATYLARMDTPSPQRSVCWDLTVGHSCRPSSKRTILAPHLTAWFRDMMAMGSDVCPASPKRHLRSFLSRRSAPASCVAKINFASVATSARNLRNQLACPV
eukprot:5016984-Pyramimonas_sp.AAC.1